MGKAKLFSAKTATFTLFFLVFVFNLFSDPVLSPDSDSYLSMSPIRSPGYPLFLSLHFLIFGEGNLYSVLVSQTIINIAAIYFISKTLKDIFRLSEWTGVLLAFLFLIPCLPPFLTGAAINYTTCVILAEGLSYPLFLGVFSFILKGVLNKNNTALLVSFFLTSLLVLIRPQFVFMLPLLLIILGYISLFQRNHFRILLLAIGLGSSIASYLILERAYYYLAHGKSEHIPFIGLQLVVQPLFLASPNDEALFLTSPERDLFRSTLQEMSAKGLTLDQLRKTSLPHEHPDARHFMAAYNPICHGIVSPLMAHHLMEKDVFQRDALLTKIALTLIKVHPISYLKLYGSNIFYANIRSYPFLFILGALSLFCFFTHYRKRDKLSLLGCIIILTTAGNLTLIAFFEPILSRYSFYTDILLAAFFIILINKALTASQGETQ